MEKITKRERFANIIANYSLNNEDRMFIEHEIELLERKASKDRKPTAKTLENIAIKENMVNTFEKSRAYTCTEIANTMGFTVNKASAMLSQLVAENKVTRETIKRKAYFTFV